MGFLAYYGVPLDLLTNLALLLTAETKSMLVIAQARRDAKRARLNHFYLSPGEQYRLHLKNGGYRK